MVLYSLGIDDRNFYGIFSIIISSKMTKTGPNTKENLQNRRKASKQSKEYKKTRKSQKMKKSVVHCVTMEATYSPRKQQKKIWKISVHRGTMTLLGDQGDEMHRISYNFELYLPIVSRWTYRATMAC
jgi:hypothetical protein